MLIERAMFEDDDAIVGAGFTVPELQHLRLDPNRVAVEQWFRELHLVPAKIGHGGADRRVIDGDTDHEGQGQAAVHQPLAEFRAFAEFLVDMQRLRVVRQRTEPDIVRLRDGATDGMVKGLTYRELFKIQSSHD